MAFTAVQFDDAAKERIRQAAAFEKRLRLESFLSIETEVGPFRLMPMQVGHVLQLEYAENRLSLGEEPQIDDIVHLLWILKPESDKRSERAFSRFVAREINNFFQLEIQGFFNVQFNDMPGNGSGETVNEYDSSVWLCSLLDALCSEYGWTIQEVMQTPMSVALQLMQRIIKRNNPKYPIRNAITQAAKAREMKGMKQDG